MFCVRPLFVGARVHDVTFVKLSCGLRRRRRIKIAISGVKYCALTNVDRKFFFSSESLIVSNQTSALKCG